MHYKTLAQLLEVLSSLERDLGLESALPVERDILAVIGSLSEEGINLVRTEMIASHPLLRRVPRSTLHRALRALVNRGAITPAEGRKTGMYVLSSNVGNGGAST